MGCQAAELLSHSQIGLEDAFGKKTTHLYDFQDEVYDHLSLANMWLNQQGNRGPITRGTFASFAATSVSVKVVKVWYAKILWHNRKNMLFVGPSTLHGNT